jgi:hypothetical protein
MKLEFALRLERLIERLLTSKLSELNTPESFDSVKVNIYPSEYGLYCHITYLMNRPFSRVESDFFNNLDYKPFIRRVMGDILNGGISSNQSTIKHYETVKDWYEKQKEEFK